MKPLYSVRFEGGEQLAAALKLIGDAASEKVQLAALYKAAEPTRDLMASTAPRGAGTHGFHLADSMTISRVSARFTGADQASVAVGPSKDAFWGIFQEYGTARHGAQPFARPAFHSNTGTSLSILGQELWAALRKASPSLTFGGGGRLA